MHSHKQHIRLAETGRRKRGSAVELTAVILHGLLGRQSGPLLIAVGGPGGTGKSTFARRLAERLRDAVVLELDHYKTSRAERHNANLFGPHPRANRMGLIAAHLAALRDGQAVAAPVYNRETGVAKHTRRLSPARWVVIDGEVSTYGHFRELIDFAVFIDSDWRTQLATRLGRDLDARGYSPDKAVATFLHSNLREFVEHGVESKQWADLHLFCHADYRLEPESISQPVYDQVRDMLHDSISPVNADGLMVSILTPFADEGPVAPRAFVDHLERLADAGVRRILVGGSAGEGFSLTAAEKLHLLKLALEYFPGFLLFHTGGGALPDAIRLAEQAADLGADALVCECPRHVDEDAPEGLHEYLKRISSATDLPLIIEVPASRAKASTTLGFPRHVPHSGLIDHDGGLGDHDAVAPRLVGDRALACGAPRGEMAGVVSAAANARPELFVEWERCLETGRRGADLAEVQSRIGEFIRSLGSRSIPAIKYLLHLRLGHYPTAVRPPLVPFDPSAAERRAWEPSDVRDA